MNKNSLVDKICLDICDGYNGKCQRFPGLAKSCGDFLKFKKAYEVGLKDSDLYEFLKELATAIDNNQERIGAGRGMRLSDILSKAEGK